MENLNNIVKEEEIMEAVADIDVQPEILKGSLSSSKGLMAIGVTAIVIGGGYVFKKLWDKRKAAKEETELIEEFCDEVDEEELIEEDME